MAVQELEKPDVTLDDSGFAATAVQKVQLDIDDAPFLREEEEEKPAPPPAPLPDVSLPAKPEKKSNKKLLIIAGAGLLLLALAGAAAFFFLGGSSTPPPPAPEAPVIIVPSTPPPAAAKLEYTIKLDPFRVPLVDAAGKRHFLVASFVLATEDGILHQEMADKIVTLRDAIYYYLANKDYEFLSNALNNEQIRSDLLGGVNNYLVQGELKSLYFDSFLIQ